MNSKIKNYVDVLFSDIPKGKKANELKEELLSNMSERYNDYIDEGKTENQAYSLVISNLGNVDELLADVIPDAEFKQEARFYRVRNARNTAISVAMYIIGTVFVIGLGGLSESFGGRDYSVLGVIILLIFVAIATGLLIYTNLSTPPEYKDYDEKKERECRLYTGKQGRVLKSLLSVYWTFITLVYLAVSFFTMQWHVTWMIWLLAVVFQGIIKTIYEMRHDDE